MTSNISGLKCGGLIRAGNHSSEQTCENSQYNCWSSTCPQNTPDVRVPRKLNIPPWILTSTPELHPVCAPSGSTDFCAPLCYSFVAFLHIGRLFHGFCAPIPIASADRTTSSSDSTGYPRPPDDGSSVAVCALAIYTFFLQQRRSHHEVSLEDSALPHLLLC
ncbi:hypothetical protein Bbelb_242450 [Branchiostoma belcheri]|nr:hypothetical protein Bbelb_242450 [Branchiostoma belcheri]